MHFDQASARDAFSGPGVDTRQWFTHGLVEPDTEDAHSVTFMDGDGNPHPNGIIVMVKLVMSGIVVPCRVLAHAAGEGEGEYSPFGPGDEVIVAVADGDERSGCYIVGRCSNGPDVFPMTVAGQDVTQNNVSFRRISTPYIFETSASYMVRSATTKASWSIDPTGNVIFADGEGNMLSLSQSTILLQESTGTALIQIDPEKLTVALQSNQTALLLDDKNGASSFITPGTFMFVTSGGGYASGHAVTVEQLTAYIFAVITSIGSLFTIPLTPPAVLTLMEAIIPLASTSTIAPFTALITTALAVPADPAGLIPGIARAGLLF